MTKQLTWTLSIALGALTLAATAGMAAMLSDEDVTLEQLPEAVRAALLAEAHGARITEIERDTKNGRVVYEAEFIVDGREHEIALSPDGTVLGRKVEDDDDDDLTLDQLPVAARAALLKLAGSNRITEVEREREHGVMVYEAEWTAGGTAHEAAVLADGTLLETEEIVPVVRTPTAVQRAISEHFGDAQVEVALKTIMIYEAEARIDGREVELVIFPTGAVHQVGDDNGDDHHGDDDDDDDDGGDDDDDD